MADAIRAKEKIVHLPDQRTPTKKWQTQLEQKRRYYICQISARHPQCSTKCEEKCRVGSWENWSHCTPIDCHKDGNQTVRGYQTRRRRVVSGPDSLTSCPHLEETRTCSLTSCYKWGIIPGKNGEVNTKCFTSERGAVCGHGKRKYSYRCLDYSEEPVENELCRHQKIDLSQESCYVPCPDDCVWSSWSSIGALVHKDALGQRSVYLFPKGIGLL
ncbi:unnamed protein product [Lepeophtheirus salmonis]|uniref:(salmon louse) hypothetical protein n=1 Tax=Lepeophtheirus salmonis TaxID=72036 RepID=A0A7R8CIM7_LEPSM|nr:unnamed protein product [Lepeophtheirus salmonis]CAF2802676.1 unnamed protein product [Lepeophtheirus salmonis]